MVRIAPQTAMLSQPPQVLHLLCLGKKPISSPDATHDACANAVHGQDWLPLIPVKKGMGSQGSRGEDKAVIGTEVRTT